MGASFVAVVGCAVFVFLVAAAAVASVMVWTDAAAAALIFDSCAAGPSRNAFDREVARHLAAREPEQQFSSRHEA